MKQTAQFSQLYNKKIPISITIQATVLALTIDGVRNRLKLHLCEGPKMSRPALTSDCSKENGVT